MGKSVLLFITIFSLIVPHYSIYSKDKSEVAFSQGVKYLKENRLKEAEASFKKVTKTIFGHYPSLFNLSLIYFLKKDYKKCENFLTQAKQLNPFDIRIDKMLSSVYIMLNKPEIAQKYLAAIIFKKPQDTSAHQKLGIIYLQKGKIKESISEFTLVKNLLPKDLTNSLLLSISYALDNNFSKSLEKLVGIESRLHGDYQLGFYAFVLEKNGLEKEAEQIYKKIKKRKKGKKILERLISSLKEEIVFEEMKGISAVEDFEIPEVSKRIVEKLKKEQIPLEKTKKAKKLPFNLKGSLTQTFEIYKRSPLASSPINGFHSTSNLKLQGYTKKRLRYSSQWEWFYNRWDHTVLDYYKVNLSQTMRYEIDIGKFSPKHFPTLVSYPTVEDGLRLWRKINLASFKPEEIILPENLQEPFNLGEMYRKAYTDTRLFKTTEITLLVGRTLERINLNARTEKNENTYDTSGQFEQWTQAFRIYSRLTSFMDLGVSLAITKDRPDSATVSSTTYPIYSEALGLDGGINLLDNKLTFNWEIATNNFDENIRDTSNKNKRDIAWIIKSKYRPTSVWNFSYEQKAIGKNFEVEGAYQTEDKISHTINFQYRPSNPKVFSLRSLSLKFQPEETNFRRGGENKKKYRTFQPVISFQLPQEAKLTFDYKYYREKDKCNCSNYRTRTFTTELDWEIKPWQTTIKPSYTFERKDDRVTSPTDEKSKEFSLSIENTSIKNLTLKFSVGREIKQYVGYTTKSYHEHTYSLETKYAFIPYRSDLTFKISRDKKDPSDTNETDLVTLQLAFNYTSKSGNDRLSFQIERKNNIYEPWSETSAYRQNYAKLKFTHKF